MKERNHKLLDHPVLGYFILAIFAYVMSSLIFSTIIDSLILANVIPGYGVEVYTGGRKVVAASGVGSAVGALAAVGIFCRRFRTSFDGMLKKKDLLTGLLLLLPAAIPHWIGSIVSWTEFGTASVLLAFLRALAPGFGEEVTFRGLGVANYLRRVPTEKGVAAAFWLSSVVFGAVHMLNVGSGAPLGISVLQSVYAIGIGMAMGAVYLRTGNLWPSIIIHTSLDFMEFIRNDLGNTAGVMSGLGKGDWITVAAGLAGCIWGLYLIRPSKRGGIVELWKGKWKMTDNS